MGDPAASLESEVTPLPAPAGVTVSLERAARLKHARALRTVIYLMLFRVGIATLLMVSVVSIALMDKSPERLAGPFGRFIFLLLAITYLASVVYGLRLKTIRNPMQFAAVQIGIDLAVISVLVHATGGAQSGYHFLFLLDVVAVALLPSRSAVLWIAGAAALCMTAVSVAGYMHLLPTVPGQTVFPWDLPHSQFLFRCVLNLAAVISVGALGYTLSQQSREAGLRLERHEQFAGDLASLHENTIRCLSSGLVTTTTDGRITTINDAASEILGLASKIALGQELSKMIPGLKSLLDKAGPRGDIRRQEVDARRPDGTVRRLGLSATPLTDHTNQVIGRVLHFQDLTDLREMEQQVARAERLASIGRLAAGVAHEIRNPLASISGSVETLKSLRDGDEDSRLLANIVVREVDRLNELITALLDYARPPNQQFERLDLSRTVAETVTSFEQGMPRARVIARIDAGVMIDGSENGLRQLLWNLLKNADEALLQQDQNTEAGFAPCAPSLRTGAANDTGQHNDPDGNADCGGSERIRNDSGNGSSTDEPTGTRRQTAVISVSLESVATDLGQREAAIKVEDNGVGIGPDIQEQIFEPFFTRGKAKGTGLGLALVNRIVEDHGGSLTLNSTPGEGTLFTIRLACAAEPREALQSANA